LYTRTAEKAYARIVCEECIFYDYVTTKLVPIKRWWKG